MSSPAASASANPNALVVRRPLLEAPKGSLKSFDDELKEIYRLMHCEHRFGEALARIEALSRTPSRTPNETKQLLYAHTTAAFCTGKWSDAQRYSSLYFSINQGASDDLLRWFHMMSCFNMALESATKLKKTTEVPPVFQGALGHFCNQFYQFIAHVTQVQCQFPPKPPMKRRESSKSSI